MLNADGITFTEIDLEQSPDAVAIVERVNNGNQTVPTLVFSDGEAMTNPSVAKVKRKTSLASNRLISVARRRNNNWARFIVNRYNFDFVFVNVAQCFCGHRFAG